MEKNIISILEKDKKEILQHHDMLYLQSLRIRRLEQLLLCIIVILLLNISIKVFFYFYSNKKVDDLSSNVQNH